jgi:hypothetical protein
METKRQTETDSELHKEINTQRTYKNPNLGHTVTFHWFQMTRKLLETFALEDAKLVYTSGKHNPIRIFVKGEVPEALTEHFDESLLQEMPPDVARRMPPNSAIVVVSEPYTEVVSMAAANAYLARVFRPAVAVEINGLLWQALGFGRAAPSGLGVLAFPGAPLPQVAWPHFVPLFNDDPEHAAAAAPARVAADRITVRRGAGADEVLFLPNLDLRYKLRDGQVPTRYFAQPHDPYAVPRMLYANERIVNTNGVFCDAMVGNCTALESYLERHRDIDLLEKKIKVGQQEIELQWALAKDNLMMIEEEQDRSVVALVKPLVKPDPAAAGKPFEGRLELEEARRQEQLAIAGEQVDLKRAQKELELLTERVNEMKKRIDQIGKPVTIDAPDGSKVEVEAKVNLGGPEPPPGSVKVE